MFDSTIDADQVPRSDGRGAAKLAAGAAALAARLAAAEPLAGADPSTIRVVHAPGRVNLIGEHTDYNEGFVLPAAIDMGISIALFPTDDRRVEITLADGGERDGFDLDAIGERRGRWIDYVAGTAWAMAESGAQIRGFRGLLASDLPAGAGLSSSAAFELEYVNHESGGSRVVVETAEWLAVVPFWAAWPFETLLVPKRPAARLFELDDVARDDLATVLPELLGRYDGLFKRPFPYSMGWHQAPFGDPPTDAWQVHAHFYMRKFMVGYELLAETQRDLTAEDAAARLRAVSGAGTPAIAAAPLANPA